MTQITRHNPAGLPRNPAFSQAVSVQGPTRTIYVGGQNAVEADDTVASQVLAAQTAQALGNLEAGADQHAGDGVQPWLGPEPAGQSAEGGEGGGGEAAVEAVQQPGYRAGRPTGSIGGDLVVG